MNDLLNPPLRLTQRSLAALWIYQGLVGAENIVSCSG